MQKNKSLYVVRIENRLTGQLGALVLDAVSPKAALSLALNDLGLPGLKGYFICVYSPSRKKSRGRR